MSEIITEQDPDTSLDCLTIVKTTDGTSANKIIDYNDGQFSKSAGANHSHFFARTVTITNFHKDFPAVLDSLGCDEAIILGWVPGTEDGATFELYSKAKLNRALGRPEEDRPLGMYQIDGVTVCARLQENFHYGRIVLFDVDRDEAMRDELRVRDPEHFAQMMARIHHSFAGVTMLCVPSASNRVVVNGEPVMCSGSIHIYMQRKEHDPGERWANNLLIHASEAGYGYMKPSYFRTGERAGQVCAQTPVSIWDQTTLKGSNRLDFAGMPTRIQRAYDAGARIVQSKMMIIKGGAWDSKAVTLPPDDVVQRFTQATNTNIKIKKEKIAQALAQTDDGLLGAASHLWSAVR